MNNRLLKNSILGEKFSSKEENPVGDLLEEVLEQDFCLGAGTAYDSERLGNQGKRCSLTRECQRICNWISYGSGGAFGC